MLGTGLTGSLNEAKSFEFMRIADSPEDGRPVFWGSPGGQAPVAFPMVAQGRQEVTFENPAHDYPTRISYKREGEVLTATTSGRRGSNPQTWRYAKARRSGLSRAGRSLPHLAGEEAQFQLDAGRVGGGAA